MHWVPVNFEKFLQNTFGPILLTCNDHINSAMTSPVFNEKIITLVVKPTNED